jgi:hypothetical protein
VLIITLLLGFTNKASTTRHQQAFLAPLPGRIFFSARGVSHAQSFTLLLFCFTLFLLALFYQKHKKLVPLKLLLLLVCFLVFLEWVVLRTPSYVILLAPKTMILSALLLHHLLLSRGENGADTDG